MIDYEGLDRNFQFLVLEVQKQLEATRSLLHEPSERLIYKVLSRDSYTDALKALIEKKCISYFRHYPTIDKSSANLVTAINVTTINLERMADFCANIAKQTRRIAEPSCLHGLNCDDYFAELLEAIPQVSAAFDNVDTSTALQLCQTESRLDRLYENDFHTIRDRLRAGGSDTDDLLACLYVVHYLERMGDSLLNIGEAVLFAATGEKVKLHEYLRLRDALTTRQPDSTMRDYKFEFNWETQSGCRIAKIVDTSDAPKDSEAIFKKGQAEKMRNERLNIARWEKVRPHLPPRVLEFRESEDDAVLLLEFIDGLTIRDLILNGDVARTDESLTAFETTLESVWKATATPVPVNAEFVRQIRTRLDDVFRIHPELLEDHAEIGDSSAGSLEELLDKAQQLDAALIAPFSVLIHGDMNTDNILFTAKDSSIHLIDLHRSCDSDYVQDVSVFLVSNFRVPILDAEVRHELNRVTLRHYAFARRFAASTDDITFSARLALGLARSYITSTRFELDLEFARLMYGRAVYLLERLVAHHPAPWSEFELTEDIMVY